MQKLSQRFINKIGQWYCRLELVLTVHGEHSEHLYETFHNSSYNFITLFNTWFRINKTLSVLAFEPLCRPGDFIGRRHGDSHRRRRLFCKCCFFQNRCRRRL